MNYLAISPEARLSTAGRVSAAGCSEPARPLRTCESGCRYGQADRHHRAGLHGNEHRQGLFTEGEGRQPRRQRARRVGHTATSPTRHSGRDTLNCGHGALGDRGDTARAAGRGPPSCGGRGEPAPAAPRSPRGLRGRERSQRPLRALRKGSPRTSGARGAPGRAREAPGRARAGPTLTMSAPSATRPAPPQTRRGRCRKARGGDGAGNRPGAGGARGVGAGTGPGGQESGAAHGVVKLGVQTLLLT